MDAVTLANGDVVEFTDPTNLKERSRRSIEAAYFELEAETFEELEAAAKEERKVNLKAITPKDRLYLDTVNDVCIAAVIKKWSHADGTTVFPSADNIGDLDSQSYADLNAAATPLVLQIKLDFDPTPVGVESPTDPSGA